MPDFAQITALEAQLQREVFEEPPKDAVAVRTADGRRIGLMHSKRAQKLATDTRFCDDFQLTEDALVVFPQSSDSLEADFARVARPLHDAGYFVQWRDELLDVDDLDTGECIAHAERGLFRFFGMLTSSVYGVGVRTDGRVFVRRFALTTLLHFYVDEEGLPFVLDCLRKVNAGEYYVSMAAAWLAAEVLVKFPEAGTALLAENALDAATHNRAIRKACESFRVSEERKTALRALRRSRP